MMINPHYHRLGVSDRLVPASGCWWGTCPGEGGGLAASDAGLTIWEGFAGRAADIVHVYKTSTSWTGIRTTDENNMFGTTVIPFYNWKPGGTSTYTWAQIASGSNDANITTWATNLAAYKYRLFICIEHEPDNDTGGDAAAGDYRAMWRHIVGLARAAGASNIVWVWNMTGYSSQGENSNGKGFNRFWPGDDVVDWVAWNPYQLASLDDLNELMVENAGAVSGWPGFYSWATTAKTADSDTGGLDLWYDFGAQKPLMMAEWGNWFDINGDAAGADFITSIASQIASYPRLKAMVQYNFNADHTNHIDGYALAEAAYAATGAIAHFNVGTAAALVGS